MTVINDFRYTLNLTQTWERRYATLLNPTFLFLSDNSKFYLSSGSKKKRISNFEPMPFSTAFTLYAAHTGPYRPIPIPDVKNQNCEKCGQECSGYYLQPVEHIEHVRQNAYGACQFKPPKSVIEESSNDKAKKNATFTNEELLAMADNCCPHVHMWVEHVNDTVSRRKARVAERSRKEATQEKGYLCSILC